MKRLLIIAALSGCASMAPQGRYLQFKVGDTVGFQFTYPTAGHCSSVLAATVGDMRPNLSCVTASASSRFKARATLRDKNFDYLYEFEAISKEQCEATVAHMTTGVYAASHEVVAPCKDK